MRTFALRLLEIARGAGERASRAHRAHERADLAARVVPDLGPRGLEVRLAVHHVVELVGPDRVGQRLGEAPGDLLVVVGVHVGLRRHRTHLGAERAQQVHLLLRLVVGNHDHAPVAARGADVGEPDARVARGALDHGATGLERAAALGVLDDEERGAILHRSAGIEELGLAEDLAAGLLRQAREPDQRRVADRSRESLRVSPSADSSAASYLKLQR